ncbi:MAG: glycosyltransferase family 4 protein [Tepidisphaeraceae bacterium]
MPSSLKLIVPLTRLHCQDGIASHLATLLPRLKQAGMRIFTAVGSIDVPPGTEAVLELIRLASETFEVDERLLVYQKRLTARTLCRQVAAIRSLLGRAEVSRSADKYVVHLQGRGLGPAIRIATFCKRNLVFTSQLSLGKLRPASASVKGRLKAWAVADRVIAISRELAAELRYVECHPAGNIRGVFHGIDTSRFSPASVSEKLLSREKLGITNEAFVIGILARIAAIKRHDTLAAACEMLVEQGRNVHLIIAGDGDPQLVESLRHRLSRSPMNNSYCILGFADARDVIWACDATVLPSEREGFGISVCESMACGVIPLRTPVEGALDQIIDGKTGFLFPVGNSKVLAEQLSLLMDNPAVRQNMSEAATQYARDHFSADVMAEKTLAVYRKLAYGEVPDPRTLFV